MSIVSPGSPVTLLYTNSFDGTSDLVVRRLGADSVFRFNFDLWRDYRVEIGADDFELANPAGRTIRAADVAKVWWRKPAPTRDLFPERPQSALDAYLEEELWYAMRDLVSLLARDGKLVLVEPAAEQRIGKLVQLRAAADLFPVPAWRFVRGASLRAGRTSVAKSLTLKRVAAKSVMYASRVPEGELDPSMPWMLQDYVDATHDVTAVFVRGALHAFSLPRAPFLARTIDWREVSLDEGAARWTPEVLPERAAGAIGALMRRLGLDYGRLDFLRRADGELVFLEVNPHGEFGWLDPDGAHGLLDAILAEVSPRTPANPIAAPQGATSASR